MDFTRNLPQASNLLFTFLLQLQSTVVWVCTPDYKKQLFLSDSFNDIWGISKEHMYNDMGIWMETIYPDDLQTIKKGLKKREVKSDQCNTINYRIQNPNKELRYIASTAYTIHNQDGKPAAVIGIEENLPSDQWEQSKNTSLRSSYLLKDLSSVFSHKLKLITPVSQNAVRQPKTIVINNNVIPLTNRESECLIYLIEGRSAKETAYYLKISTRTVEAYLDKIRYKANCRTKTALVAKIQQSNLLS